MNKKILKYVFFELLRNKFIWIYTLLLMMMSLTVIYLGQNSSKSVISILNIVLFIIPLVSIVFGTIHFYNSGEFVEFLLTQPLNRKTIFWSEYFGITLAFSVVFIVGVGMPLLVLSFSVTGIYLIITGLILTYVFISLAFLSSVINKDKVKGIGLSIILWIYFSVIFDGLILSVFYLFRDYPLNKLIIFLTSLNPVDLSRITILLQVDISALMGFSGATFQNYLGTATGKIYSFFILFIWILIPSYLSYRKFNKKNF